VKWEVSFEEPKVYDQIDDYFPKFPENWAPQGQIPSFFHQNNIKVKYL